MLVTWVKMGKRVSGVRSRANVKEQWAAAYEGIRQMRAHTAAPVDIEGCAQTGDKRAEAKVWRFQTLVSLMLSAQTKDAMTFAVTQKLRSRELTVGRILRTPEKELAEEIYGVSFHNNKAKYIKKVADILHEKYDGDIPDQYKELIALPGVGPKMALLALNVCFGKVEGIAVDTHVHRISNRLGWVNTKTPEQTRKGLERIVPKENWEGANLILVGFGQTVCLPVRPKCTECKIRDICPTGQNSGPNKKKKRK